MKYQYTNIRTVADSIYRNPILQDLTIDDIIKYTTDFVNIVSMPGFFLDKVSKVDIKEYRGVLPCDIIKLIQVRDFDNKDAYHSSSDTYYTTTDDNKSKCLTFKQKGRFIYTSEKDTTLEIVYKSYPTDDQGMLMIPDNPVFIEALNQYITREYMTILYYQGKIDRFMLDRIEQRYAWAVGRCEGEFILNDLNEMEGLANINNQLVHNYSQHKHSYRNMNSKQKLINH